MIHRHELLDQIRRALKRSRIVVLTGPRQSGKTTLARQLVQEDSINLNLFDAPAACGSGLDEACEPV